MRYVYSDPSTGSLMTEMVYPNGRILHYGYNNDALDTAIGRVDYEADDNGSGGVGSHDVDYTYLGLDTVVGQAFGNGVTETTTLDQFGRTAEIKYVNSSDVTTDDFQYGYDQDGNVLYKLNGVNDALSELYTYDNLNRLTSYEEGTLNDTDSAISGTPSETQSFDYDALGNQLSVTFNGTEVDNTVNSQNELTENGSASLTYDNDGNTLTDSSGNQYTYNAWYQEMIVTTSGDASLASYTYDANGNRISQTEDGATTVFYLSDAGQTIEERQGSTVTSQNLWGLTYVNNLVQRTEGSTVYYIQEDANFDTTAVTNSGGTVQERYTYLPYGAVTVRNADGSVKGDGGNDASTVSEPFLFQSGRLDASTGENHFGIRDETTMGTWGEQDPETYINGSNIYAFELSNPERYLDENGTDATTQGSYGGLTGISYAQGPFIQAGAYEYYVEFDYNQSAVSQLWWQTVKYSITFYDKAGTKVGSSFILSTDLYKIPEKATVLDKDIPDEGRTNMIPLQVLMDSGVACGSFKASYTSEAQVVSKIMINYTNGAGKEVTEVYDPDKLKPTSSQVWVTIGGQVPGSKSERTESRIPSIKKINQIYAPDDATKSPVVSASYSINGTISGNTVEETSDGVAWSGIDGATGAAKMAPKPDDVKFALSNLFK